VLVHEHFALSPSEDELGKLTANYFKSDFIRVVTDGGGQLVAPDRLQRVAEIDAALAGRLRPALDIMVSFATVESTARDAPARLDSAVRDFEAVLSQIGAGPRRTAYEIVGAQPLNQMCWNGTTRYSAAAIVLPLCEDAVALASDQQRPAYLDSRGVAYAVVGRIDDAIADFEAYVSSPGVDQAPLRRQWIEALTTCKSDAAKCRNPFGDAAALKKLR
jgi:hypothetical protein